MSSFVLKLIAIITMLIDHAAIVFWSYLPQPLPEIMRCVGRVAMPLFCFMIAEGFYHTRNVRKYAFRLLVFAAISELPFDLMLGRVTLDMLERGKFWNFGAQNVYFTLLLGLLGIWFYDMFAAKNMKWMSLVSILAAGAAAELLSTDYGIFGVFFVFVFYVFRDSRAGKAAGFTTGVLAYTCYNIARSGWRLTLGSTRSLFELVSLAPILLYNGKKGPGGKALQYIFYVFYPAHMLILWLVRYAVYGR